LGSASEVIGDAKQKVQGLSVASGVGVMRCFRIGSGLAFGSGFT
jgi:hypothetical protein